jgi:hypothetical protein
MSPAAPSSSAAWAWTRPAPTARDLWHAEAGVVTVRGAYTLALAPRSGALLRIEP